MARKTKTTKPKKRYIDRAHEAEYLDNAYEVAMAKVRAEMAAYQSKGVRND
jgi:hypothetical protein